MERDFLKLNSENSFVADKEDIVDGSYMDSGFGWSSRAPWLPHFTALSKSEQDEQSSKLKSDALASQGYIQNFGIASMKQKFLSGNPITPPNPVLPSTVVEKTEKWNNTMTSNGRAPLTIFYDGNVNVFEDISPEKAQAIMFLAGNDCISSNMAQAKQHLQEPMSVFPPPIDKYTVRAPRIKVDLPRMESSSVVPQARQASLARFLEKRKERAMSSAPFNLNKKANDRATPEPNRYRFSATSRVGSVSDNI